MVITSKTLQAVNKNVRTTFWDAYHGAGDRLVDRFAMRTGSSTAENIYGWLGAIPGLEELIGEFAIANILEHAYKIANRTFGRIVGIKREDIERDSLGTYSPLIQAIAIAANSHPDELLIKTITSGFTELSYTGKPFFANDHEPKKKGTKFSNLGTKKLSAANFDIARQNIMSRLNYEGRPMGLGRDLVLMVSPKNDKLARDIVIADRVNGGDSNTLKGTASMVSTPWLAGANEDMWFLFDLGYPVKPFINQVEVETEFTSQDNLTDDSVFERDEFRHKAYRRGNTGYGLPETAYGSTGAQAA